VHLLPSPTSPSWYCSKTYRDSFVWQSCKLLLNPLWKQN
jgi:hypothetical protein